MGSLKYGYKSPNMGYNLLLTPLRTTHEPPSGGSSLGLRVSGVKGASQSEALYSSGSITSRVRLRCPVSLRLPGRAEGSGFRGSSIESVLGLW